MSGKSNGERLFLPRSFLASSIDFRLHKSTYHRGKEDPKCSRCKKIRVDLEGLRARVISLKN